MMKGFNAEIAKEIALASDNNELDEILIAIKAKAEIGERSVHIYKPINANTQSNLVKLGFDLVNQSSIAIQREGLYHSVYW